jgi:hypothetical protein
VTRRPSLRRISLRTVTIAATVSASALAIGAVTVAASPGGASHPTPARISCITRYLPTLGGSYGNITAAAANGDAVGLADNAAGAAQPVVWRGGKVQWIPTGLAGSVPSGVNAHGDVVGNSPDGENTLGWFWSGHRTVRLKGTRLKSLGTLAPLPAAISNDDIIVGALVTTEGLPNEGGNTRGISENEQAAVWRSPASRPRVLSPLPGDQGAHAFAVTAGGRAGGVSEGSRFRPVIWDRSGKPHALAGLGGGYGIVRAFGPGGVAVGDVVATDGTDHPVMWASRGRLTDLGLPAGSRTAHATGVLPDGVVVGTAQMPAPGGGVLSQAVRWSVAGQPQLLGGQKGLEQTVVADAASAQTAVGYRTDARGGRHPAMWRCAG